MIYYLTRFEGSASFSFEPKPITVEKIRTMLATDAMESIKGHDKYFTVLLREDSCVASGVQSIAGEEGKLMDGDKVLPAQGDVLIHSSGKYGVGFILGKSFEGRKQVYELLVFKLPEVEFSKPREFRRSPTEA